MKRRSMFIALIVAGIMTGSHIRAADIAEVLGKIDSAVKGVGQVADTIPGTINAIKVTVEQITPLVAKVGSASKISDKVDALTQIVPLLTNLVDKLSMVTTSISTNIVRVFDSKVSSDINNAVGHIHIVLGLIRDTTNTIRQTIETIRTLESL